VCPPLKVKYRATGLRSVCRIRSAYRICTPTLYKYKAVHGSRSAGCAVVGRATSPAGRALRAFFGLFSKAIQIFLCIFWPRPRALQCRALFFGLRFGLRFFYAIQIFLLLTHHTTSARVMLCQSSPTADHSVSQPPHVYKSYITQTPHHAPAPDRHRHHPRSPIYLHLGFAFESLPTRRDVMQRNTYCHMQCSAASYIAERSAP
jgi:hypothetical protein